MLDVALADDLRTRFNVAVANADAEAVGPLLQSKGVLVGLADSGAHVGQLCDACFATDLLATWWRTRGTLSLGEATQAFLFFRARFLAEIANVARRRALEANQAAALFEEADRALDTVILALIHGHRAT